jgi:hypothetical protein
MLKVFGENYYFDLDKIEDYVNIPNVTGVIENHISVVKFELVN